MALSRGVAGRVGARNTMPLMNLAWDHFFFWDARALSVELQAFEPVTGHREMGSDWHTVTERLAADQRYPPMFRAAFGDARIDSLRVAFALAQFERTLISLNSRYDRFHHHGDATAMDAQEQRGESIFFGRAHCVDCHAPPFFKDHHVVNIGLERAPGDDGMGARTGIPWHRGRFKTPTLRNIAVTAPYMHDGRFATLEEVVDFYAEDVNVDDPTLDEHMMPWVRGEVRLSVQDRNDLVAFLHTLTDEGFLVNPEFGPAAQPKNAIFRRMRVRPLVLATACFALLLSACRKDVGLASDSGQTPLALTYPQYVTDSGHVPMVSWGNPLTVEGVELGRRLFYEKALSNDYSMSCGSCHLQDHAFSDPRRFSIGTDGSIGHRQAMAVVNLAFDHYMFWDARVHGLEEQAARPVMDIAEMRNTWPVVVQRLRANEAYPPLFRKAFGTEQIDSTRVVQAIAQFERTLLSFDSPWDRYTYGGEVGALNDQELRGMELYFRQAHCNDCHKAPLFADHALRNNGLDLLFADPGYGAITGNPGDNGKFKVPTLRNIEVTGPYMHDGRFATLEEVVDFYADSVHVESPHLDNHMLPWMAGQINLSPADRADLVAFLKTLTDPTFLTNPTFSDPH